MGLPEYDPLERLGFAPMNKHFNNNNSSVFYCALTKLKKRIVFQAFDFHDSHYFINDKEKWKVLSFSYSVFFYPVWSFKYELALSSPFKMKENLLFWEMVPGPLVLVHMALWITCNPHGTILIQPYHRRFTLVSFYPETMPLINPTIHGA